MALAQLGKRVEQQGGEIDYQVCYFTIIYSPSLLIHGTVRISDIAVGRPMVSDKDKNVVERQVYPSEVSYQTLDALWYLI